MVRAALIEATAWPAELGERLSAIAAEHTPPQWYRDEWDAGRLQAFVYGDRALILVRICTRADGEYEAVIVAATAVPTSPPLIGEVLPQLEDLARDAGCASLRLHTNRPGLISQAWRSGYDQREVVMAKEL